MRDGMPGKNSATSERDRPTASKLQPPRYDDSTEMPILDITFSRPSSSAFL